MKPNTTAIERAFELARSGRFSALADLKLAVRKEGYSAEQLQGRMLAKQLREMMRAGAPDSA